MKPKFYYIRRIDTGEYWRYNYLIDWLPPRQYASKFTEEQVHKDLRMLREKGFKITFEEVK